MFLNYSHENEDHADQLELLMRRENMILNRDINLIEPGDKLSEKIEDLIKDSDYFIALVSHSYKGSEFCEKELEYVNKLPSEDRPKIIYLIVGSDKAVTKEMEETFCPKARSTPEKEDVIKLIKNGTIPSQCQHYPFRRPDIKKPKGKLRKSPKPAESRKESKNTTSSIKRGE